MTGLYYAKALTLHMILARKEQLTCIARRESLDSVHNLAVHIVDPRAWPATLGAHGKLSLASIGDLPTHVHDHVGAERKAAKRTVAHLLLRHRIFHVGRHTQLTTRTLPAGEHRANALAAVVLVEQRLARQIGRLDLGAAQVGAVVAAVFARWRVRHAANGQRHRAHIVYAAF